MPSLQIEGVGHTDLPVTLHIEVDECVENIVESLTKLILEGLKRVVKRRGVLGKLLPKGNELCLFVLFVLSEPSQARAQNMIDCIFKLRPLEVVICAQAFPACRSDLEDSATSKTCVCPISSLATFRRSLHSHWTLKGLTHLGGTSNGRALRGATKMLESEGH